ncbi:hydroxymethylbilane synthase [Hymenobacter sp. UV11]|uniref:hydroxymethylbilane synthase n=1 Tax=Hymenobacter sp. UV11 TaxID=1849735 RepID=UPI0010608914|nr:hydroxymethylbilane synthase [Hymenobacter sp. UV11]TDN37348.1 hydroxymethylbilane synthase [Hymenobacter sp. UV11]TFZ68536.1 hydroxymethylbilane synthase [Hymenobacter sp. UV11]
MSETPIRLATRASRLALWQTEHVASLLNQAGLPTEIVPMQTIGDKVLDRSLTKIGAKGVFTEELEESLRRNETHLAIHSAKDVQSSLPPDLELVAFLEREQVNDVVISFQKDFDITKAGILLGTSSTRRKALLRRFYPLANTAEARGNLQTRLRKLEEGQYDALVLAYAGVHRMGYDSLIRHVLPSNKFVPPVGQGSIAVECSRFLDSDLKERIKAALDHPDTHRCLLAERAFLRTMEGGCSIPSFALATLTEAGDLHLHGGLISLSGEEYVDFTQTAPAAQAEGLGMAVADYVLGHGGEAILASIREQRGEL